ncbi:inactive pancreatic lipase-related protein 1-like [Lutzomyia longipalpis]|uniref:Lipase domain-containing protein n=1 Tax=Lutzomyia longipalpis TaxID=7200 RepID=A0A1B0CRT4_LUTLO|nr:inactive pancreatic lipase-related protein 1-like [Lutzomyia longipalpis]
MKYFLLLISCFFALAVAEDYAANIHFIVYRDNVPYNLSNTASGNPIEEGLCSAGDQLAMVVYGWTESCSTDWVIDLISNLTEYRGGCIICMDYSHYTQTASYIEYPIIVTQFDGIRDVLKNEMEDLRTFGFDPSLTYMFGMSFGSQVVLQAAGLLTQKIKEIDACDPAQVGFLPYPITPDPKLSADNVQCIHTSGDKGTVQRYCHQDWNMGHCGLYQDAAGLNPLNDHGTCPIFYNSAFRNNFNAIPMPLECLLPKFLQILDFRSLANCVYPSGFKMGYMQRDKQGVCGPNGGNLYAKTTATYPYN